MVSARVVGAESVIRRFESLQGDVRGRVGQSMGSIVLKLQERVMRAKLSGQVLNARSGTLRRSIDQAVYQEGAQIRGVVGTNVEYARVHEYGFSGTVTVKEHLRLIKKAFGKDLKTPREVTVRTHSARVNLPERSFLRSALRDLGPAFFESMEQAAQAVTQ